MISQLYASAKRHKGETTCTIHIPYVPEDTTEEERIGASVQKTTRYDVPCVRGNNAVRREITETGIRFISAFPLFIHTSEELTEKSTIELHGREYSILAIDHKDETDYWRVDLRHE